MLLQKQKHETTQPIGYWSHALNDTEKTYDATQREFLDIVWSVLVIRPFLDETRFSIWAGHDSFKRVLNFSNSSRQLALWHLCLSEYNLNVIYKADIKHQATDFSSRSQTTTENQTYLVDDVPVLAIDERESGKEGMHTITVHGNEEITLQTTAEQALGTPLTEK